MDISTAYHSEVLSNYHIDLWEHASKLFRLLHWQQAVEIFEFIAKEVSGPREETKCLVNKALVEARLGDYNKAVITIADAAELGEDLPITAFLAGLVNCELSQLALAEAWFEACLTGLAGHDLDYSDERLDFVLDLATVQHNIESTSQARLAQGLGFEDVAPDDIWYLPANVLFEAPPRSCEPSPTEPSDVLRFEAVARGNEPPEYNSPETTTKRLVVISRVPSSAYSAASISQGSSAPLIADAILDSPDKISFDESISTSRVYKSAPKRTYTPIVVSPGAGLSSPAQASPATTTNARELRSLERIRQREAANHAADGEGCAVPRTKIPYTWHGQQRRHFEPRDARGVSDSVTELANFVQEFAPEDSDPVPIRQSPTPGIRAKMARQAKEAAIADADVNSDEELFRPVGAKPRLKQEGRPATARRARAATVDTSTGRSQVPSSIRAPRKPTNVRWPFQDDHEHEEPLSESPASPAPVGLKPVPLDFIMRADGKTIVIEKALKTAPSMTQALKQVQEARWHDPLNRRQDPVSPLPTPSFVRQESSRGQPAELPLLQPTVYEPPAWRKRNGQQPSSTKITLGVLLSPPLSSDNHQGNVFLTPPPLNVPKRKPVSPSQTPASPGARLPSPPRSSMSRYSPSIVSSINMWDYILDKIKPDEDREKKQRGKR